MKRRVLLIGESVTLAHVARPLVFARQLKFQYEVRIATDESAHKWTIAEGWSPATIHSLSSKEFLRRLKWGECVFRESEVHQNVKEDLALFDDHRPDVVIGDFRLSLSISCCLAQIPYVSLGNAYWYNLSDNQQLPVPELPITPVIGVRAAQWLFDKLSPAIMRGHCARFNKIRRYYGLRPLVGGLEDVYLSADITALVDLKECYPEVAESQNIKFVGPAIWAPFVDLPAWWREEGWSGSVVFICLGSSGQTKVIKMIVNAFLALGWTVLLATAGRFMSIDFQSNKNQLYVADFLPAEKLMKHVQLLVCNGGSPMCQVAMAHGVPVIGVPSNLDQFLNMAMVKRNGLGVEIRPERINQKAVCNAVETIQNDNKINDRSMVFVEKSKLALESHGMLCLINQLLND